MELRCSSYLAVNVHGVKILVRFSWIVIDVKIVIVTEKCGLIHGCFIVSLPVTVLLVSFPWLTCETEQLFDIALSPCNRSAERHLALAVSLTTKGCRTARPTTTPRRAACVRAVRSRSRDAASRPCLRSSTLSTLCVPSAWSSSTRGLSRNRMTSRTVTLALLNCSVDVRETEKDRERERVCVFILFPSLGLS